MARSGGFAALRSRCSSPIRTSRRSPSNRSSSACAYRRLVPSASRREAIVTAPSRSQIATTTARACSIASASKKQIRPAPHHQPSLASSVAELALPSASGSTRGGSRPASRTSVDSSSCRTARSLATCGCRLPSAVCGLPSADCRLPTADCRLQHHPTPDRVRRGDAAHDEPIARHRDQRLLEQQLAFAPSAVPDACRRSARVPWWTCTRAPLSSGPASRLTRSDVSPQIRPPDA